MTPSPDTSRPDPVIPPDFEMGVATSSWQIEGDVQGRGRCIWDDFADQPGRIRDGCTGEPACDHVHRLDGDLDLIDWLGVDSYRFSISWPRVQPGGRGALSPRGLDFYDRLVDGLLARGIAPSATLYHWDLPSELDGAWLSRDTAYAFADYAAAMAERFGDRVSRWATLNEPWVSAFLGYANGVHAPGRRSEEESLIAAHHLMLAHGLAVPRLRAAGAGNVGIVLNLIPVHADSPEMQAAARHVDGLQNRCFLDLLAGRGWSDEIRGSVASATDFSFVHDGDEQTIAAPIDWMGENYYTVMRLAPLEADATAAVGQDTSAVPCCPPAQFAPREPATAMGWEVYPPGIVEALRLAADALPGVPLWITENGAAYDDVISPDETGSAAVHDEDRIAYYRSHISEVLRAREEGIDVRGYYAWSLFDNIEWAEGWTKRFGIVRVSPDDAKRIPKDSAKWLRERIRARNERTGS